MTSAGHQGRATNSSRALSTYHQNHISKKKGTNGPRVRLLTQQKSSNSSSDEHHHKQTIINDILEDLTADYSGDTCVSNPAGPRGLAGNHQLEASRSAEEIADAAESLLLFQSGSASVAEDTDQALVKALLNFSHQADMAPLPPQTDHCLATHTDIPAVTKTAPSSLLKPETLSIVSTGVPVCSVSQHTTNGTPELLEDMPDHELAALLPGLASGEFPLADLNAVVPSRSSGGGGGLPHDDLESPTKAGSFLNSILSSSPPKTSQAPSWSPARVSTAVAAALTFSDAPSTSKYQSPNCDLIGNRLTAKGKSFSSPFNLMSEVGSFIGHPDPQNDFGSEKGEGASFYLPANSPEDEFVEVFNFRLPKVKSVDSADSETDFVSIFDVFQNFFSKHHWDAFKGILEKNKVAVQSIQSLTPSGHTDTMEVIGVPHLERLLLANSARKDGFVKCLALNSRSEGYLASTLINTREPEPAELTSGIRTRHGDHSDISYAMWEGTKICSLLVGGGVQWVRLVDVQKNLLSPTSAIVSVPQVNSLKDKCHELEIEVHRCASSQKHRMVVYGESSRSNTLACIDVRDLPRLIQGIRRAKAKTSKRSRSTEDDLDWRSGKKKRREVSPDSSLCSDAMSSDSELYSSTNQEESSDEKTNSSDEEYVDSSAGEGTSSSRPGSALSVDSRQSTETQKDLRFQRFFNLDQRHPLAPQQWNFMKERMRRENGRSIAPYQLEWEADSFGVPKEKRGVHVPSRVDLREDEAVMRRLAPSLVSRCMPARVVLHRAHPLKVMVSNWAGVQGPVGDYQDHLFLSENSPCILCYQCRRQLSVRRFLGHSHDCPVIRPRLFLWYPGVSTPLQLWESLQAKLGRFKMFDLLFQLPDHLGLFHASESASSDWKLLMKVPKRNVGVQPPQTLEHVDEWFQSTLDETLRRPTYYPGSRPHNPSEKVSLPIQNNVTDAFQYVQRRLWHCDPLGFLLGGMREPQKEKAIQARFLY